jgi:hypothetical protein
MRAFDSLTVLDTTAYLKTMQRQRAEVRPSSDIGWFGIRTGLGQPIDELFEHNLHHVTADLLRVAAGACVVNNA